MAAAIVAALIVQYIDGTDRPTFTAANFFSYFTVISNCLFAVALLVLVANPGAKDQPPFTLLRGAATVGMIATGIIYAVLLAPAAADVDVTLQWVDFTVHTLGPIVALLDWLVDPPQEQPSLAAAVSWLLLPVVWLVYTLIRGAVVDWYPYPFLDPNRESVASIVVTCIGISVAFVVLAAALRWSAGRRATVAPAAISA